MKRLIVHIAMALACSQVATSGDITGPEAMQLMFEGKAKESISAFEKLAAEGDTKAMVQLGLFYYEGQGVKQNHEKAMDWWLIGMSNQNADAFTNLGVLHRDGLGGVPQNKKIAYCVFLTTHMCGLGSQSTVMRANSCLRRLIAELSKKELKEILSNYTLGYVNAYIQARGKMKGIPDKYKASKDNPALKDLPWWFEGELDGIFGPPSKEELLARKNRREEQAKAYEASKHNLTYQIKYPSERIHYDSCTFITGMGMGSGSVRAEDVKKVVDGVIYEDYSTITASPKRFIALEDREKSVCLIYELEHPSKSEPSDWTEWQSPAYAINDGMDKFGLISGNEPKSKTDKIPDNAPLLRFKVEKQ